MTHVERSIEVGVPVRTAYDQWTQFEEFPRFMQGVSEVRQIGDALTHWVAEIAGVRREWDAAILEQVPDRKVAWAATTGATNAGAVYFDAVSENVTRVRLTLDYEPEGVVERVADVLDVIDRQAVADLDRFKEFIEQRGAATGGWRGRVEEGGVQVDGGGTGVGSVAAVGGTAAAGAVAVDRLDVTDLPGAPVAVGPTGQTRSTLDTEPDDGTAAPAASDRSGEVPGDVVAVGPTGGTHSTLDTETGPAQNPALAAGDGPTDAAAEPPAHDTRGLSGRGVDPEV